MNNQESYSKEYLKQIINVCLLTANEPLDKQQLLSIFDHKVNLILFDEILIELAKEYSNGGMELLNLATGYRVRSKTEFQPYLNKLHQIKPPKYSRALMETIAIIAYHQPITRGEIEAIRGISVNSNILQILFERGWIETVGYKQIPGKPELIATTTKFLEELNINSLELLPKLPEIDLTNLQNNNPIIEGPDNEE